MEFMKYQEWISEHYPTYEFSYGKCAEATIKMVAQFPELKRIRGHYYCFIWGERQHWWCVDPLGWIIDPTSMQFPSKGTGDYVEWNESSPEPTGKCPNCSEFCYNNNYCCSENCSIEYAAYCTNPF